MAAIRLEQVEKVYPDGHVATRGLDLDIADGEFLALVGPSGCGKSTALRLVAGLETATRGRIVIGDRDVTALPPQERDLAMVFQSYALYPHKTVRENLALGPGMARRGPGPRGGWGGGGGGGGGNGAKARPKAGAGGGGAAPAGGAGGANGAPAAGFPAGRAALQPRRPPARA